MKVSHKFHVSDEQYLHGFSPAEQRRLYSQARILASAVYARLPLKNVKNLLEIGCGVGAQSEILLTLLPKLKLTSIDQNSRQLETALEHREQLKELQASGRWDIQQMNAKKMTFKKSSFDGVFLCWILEHVDNPLSVVKEAFRVLEPGGIIMATEVMNSSLFIHPLAPSFMQYWQRLNDYQRAQAGDPFVGIKMPSLFKRARFKEIQLLPHIFHFDESCPKERRQFLNYWRELSFSGEKQLLANNYVDKRLVKNAKRDFDRVMKDRQAIFTYTFFQCIAYKPGKLTHRG